VLTRRPLLAKASQRKPRLVSFGCWPDPRTRCATSP